MNDEDIEMNEQCDQCGTVFYLLDGFLGNVDVDDESCSFNTPIVALCSSCAKDRGIELDM